MPRELFTSPGEYQVALDRLLALATKRIWIYDEDLTVLRLETPERIELLRAPLAARHPDGLRIAVRNLGPLQQRQPLLQNLLRAHTHNSAAQQTAEQLASLRDSMILVDDVHALIRFDRDQWRSKLLIDEPDEVAPYRRRFEDIWAEGGTPYGATTLGL